MWHTDLRREALALQAELDAVAGGALLPPHLQSVVEACRDDLAIILAATDPDTATLLEQARVPTFEALRGLLRPQ